MSDDDVEITHVNKKPRITIPQHDEEEDYEYHHSDNDDCKEEEEEDYSHFVTVFDIENGVECIEEKQGKGKDVITVQQRDKTQQMDHAEENGENATGATENIQRCPICLEPIENATLPNFCIHQFCFICILQWSQLTPANPTCPICKQAFTSLVHSMQSSKEFKVHYLEPYIPKSGNTQNRHNTITRTNTSIASLGSRPPTQPFKTVIDHKNFLRNDLYSDVYMQRRAVYARGLKAIPQSYHTFPKTPRLAPASVNAHLIRKLRPWITRELTAILGVSDVSVLTELVISLLKQDIHSPSTQLALQEFIGEHVNTFVHELACFACSSHFEVATYDKYVRYDKPSIEIDT